MVFVRKEERMRKASAAAEAARRVLSTATDRPPTGYVVGQFRSDAEMLLDLAMTVECEERERPKELQALRLRLAGQALAGVLLKGLTGASAAVKAVRAADLTLRVLNGSELCSWCHGDGDPCRSCVGGLIDPKNGGER
jgi:hypothetical protein